MKNSRNESSNAVKRKAVLICFLIFVLMGAFGIGYFLYEKPETAEFSAADQEALLREFVDALNAGDNEGARRRLIEEVPYRIPANEFSRAIAASLKIISISEPDFPGSPVREVELEILDTKKIMSRAWLEYLQIFNKTSDHIDDSDSEADLARIYGALLKMEPLPRETILVLVTFDQVPAPENGQPQLKIVYNLLTAELFSGNLSENVRKIQP